MIGVKIIQQFETNWSRDKQIRNSEFEKQIPLAILFVKMNPLPHVAI